ncbi:unnamed protein product [Lactuca saligna]|uniref:Uncharacterized protein n=1 Tax=Lactuca saligna TaxID=75948 RepID=A0AA35YB51_LACSI|nr:unnamed protein product [Lactuca saligna]
MCLNPQTLMRIMHDNYDASNEEDSDYEDDDNDDIIVVEDNDDENDDDSEAGNKEGADKEEDADKDEEESIADMGEDFIQNMNSPPRLNKHFHFSTASSSSSSIADTIPHGSTPPVGDTTDPMIQVELSPKTSPSPQVVTIPQVEIIHPTETPIIIVSLYHGDQEASSSKFQNGMLSQLSLILHITHSMDRRLTKVEKYVAIIKQCTTLGNDDYMVFDDTLPCSTSDQPPPPPPPSINLPPPSYSPPITPPNSPPQYDDAKKQENNQESPQPMQMQMMIASQPNMTRSVEAEVDPQKQIVVNNISNADVDVIVDNQPIPNFGD